MRARGVLLLLVLLGGLVLVPASAEACPVCFGNPDSPMAQGVNNGIMALLGVIGAVQIGFVALFLSIRRRSRRLQERKESFKVIPGGVR